MDKSKPTIPLSTDIPLMAAVQRAPDAPHTIESRISDFLFKPGEADLLMSRRPRVTNIGE